MNPFTALLWLNLKAMLSSFHIGGKRKRAASGLGAIAFMAGIALYISGTYSFLFASQLAPLGELDLLMQIMSLLAVALGLMFTLFAAQGVIFGGRDNDLMLSLPVPAFTLMLARTSALYVENLIFSVFVLLPAGAAYLWFGGSGGVVFPAALLTGSLFLAVIPTLFSLLLGFVLAWLSGKFKRRALFSSLLYFAAFFLLMGGVFWINKGIADPSAYSGGRLAGGSAWGLPFRLFSRAVCGGEVLSLLALGVLCLLPFLLAVGLFALRYKKIVTALSAHCSRSDYKLGALSASGCCRALLRKEARRFFGTPIYLFNSGMGLILLLVAGGMPLVLQGQVAEVTAQIEGAGVPMLFLAAAAVCFLLSTVAVTAPSISLEGRQIWILKEAPISAAGIFTVKVGFQLLLTLPCLLTSTICLCAAFGFGFGEWLTVFVLGLAFSLCTAQLGLLVNLWLPKLDAPNDTVVVKQSASVLVSILSGFLLTAAGGLLCVVFRGRMGNSLALLPPIAFYLAGSAVLCLALSSQGTKMFRSL